ncbi:MAG: multidrug effflux MFS transporter [Actinomycetes bacterium]
MKSRQHLPLLGALMSLVPVTIDAYLPALPLLERDFGSTTTFVQYSVMACLLGSATGQLFVGSISDSFGRRPTLFWGLSLFTVTSLACAWAPSITIFLALRYLQGITSSVGTVMSRAIVRDLLDGNSAARAYSALMIIMGVAPIVSPIIGSTLLNFASWRSIFYFLAFFGLILITLVLITLPETLPKERRIPTNREAKREARSLVFKDPLFRMSVIASAFVNGTLLVYLSTSTFALQREFQISPQLFSILFAANGLGIVAAGQTNRRLLLNFGPATMLRFGCGWGASWGLALAIYSHVDQPALWISAALLLLTMSTIGFTFANCIALATHHHAARAGTAAGYFGACQTFLGAIFAAAANAVSATFTGMAYELFIPMAFAAIIIIPLLPRYAPTFVRTANS